jgi:HlyD family secretion protein
MLAVAAGAAGYLLLLRPLQVAVATPALDVPVEVYGLGSVEARVVSAVGFEVSGTIRALHADQGDRVAAGAILAGLDSRQQEARVAQAEAGVEQARAALEEAEAALGKAEVVLAQARRTSARRQELARGRIISDQVAEEALTAVETAAAEHVQAASRIRVAQANLDQAEATLVRERTLLDQHSLTAPFAAAVVTRHRELGSPARAADPVFDLVDPETVWVRAYVDEALSGRLAVGQPARIRLRSLPGASFQGTVARIGIENDRIGEERRIEVTCRDCPADFHLGEQAEVIVTTARLGEALMVPHLAFEEADARGGTLWTVEEGRLQRRRIAFGHRALDGRIEVPPGALPPGALVVAERRPGLRVGREAVARPPGGAP